MFLLTELGKSNKKGHKTRKSMLPASYSQINVNRPKTSKNYGSKKFSLLVSPKSNF